MKHWLQLGILTLIILAFSSPTSAQIYKWKDKEGNIHFSDIPPPKEVKAERQKIRESQESPAAEGSQARPVGKEGLSDSPKKEKRSYGDITVLLYMTDWCPYCRKARE